MKYASFSIGALFLATSLVIACAASDPGPATDTAPTDPTPETAPTGTGSAAAPKVCVAKCSKDSECQDSCPEQANAVQCCDQATNTCFPSNGKSCPVPKTDDGGTPPTY